MEPSLYFEQRCGWNSPYINHFIQPDSIIPDQTSPQSWDRYSYVNNNPLRYTDPTGHRACERYDGYASCFSEKQVANLIKLEQKAKQDKNKSHLLTDSFANHQLLGSWDFPIQIDTDDFNGMLSLIRYDVHDKSKSWLILAAVNYDTPFFNGYGLLSGTGCFGDKCYDRSELNYVAQGELWAAVGITKEQGHDIVGAWKRKTCSMNGTCLNPAARNQPSAEVLEMFDIGFDHYHALYPPGPIGPPPVAIPAPSPRWP